MIYSTPSLAHAAAAASDSGSGPLPSSGSLNNMFLQLLVAQLQNQSPLNPMDPTQFVGQLAQFSELSEVTSIHQILAQQAPSAAAHIVKPASNHSEAAAPTPASQLPASILSAAVSAAQAAAPNFQPPASSILTHKSRESSNAEFLHPSLRVDGRVHSPFNHRQ